MQQMYCESVHFFKKYCNVLYRNNFLMKIDEEIVFFSTGPLSLDAQ